MKSVYCAIVIVLLAMVIGCASPEQNGNTDAGVKAATAWLELIDTGEFPTSWDQSAALFKSAVSKDQWIETVQAVRDPLGNVLEREQKTALYKKSLPGAPDGEYVMVQFSTVFENKKAAVETVTSMLDSDGSWRVSGYFVK